VRLNASSRATEFIRPILRHSPATFDGAVHRDQVCQVAHYDLCAEPSQSFGTIVLTPNQGAHRVSLCEQEFGEVAADAAHSTGRSRYEDGAVVFTIRHHIADFGLRYQPSSE